MRMQILLLLSAVGLALSTAPASAQQPMGGKEKHGIKWSKADGMSNTRKTNIKHAEALASGKRQDGSSGGNTASTRKLTLNPQPLPPGVHTLNPQPLPPGVHTDVGGKGLSAREKLTLNPQPLPPGVHTLNPQPLPPGVYNSNNGKASRTRTTTQASGKGMESDLTTKGIPPGPNVIHLKADKADQLRGSSAGGAGAGKVDKLGNTSSAASRTDGSWGSKKNSTGKKQQFGASNPADARVTLNPQPLPPGVHTDVGGKGLSAGKKLTLNPQPLPPGVHTQSPQPLPPGVHIARDRTKK